LPMTLICELMPDTTSEQECGKSDLPQFRLIVER
jgi:hypothetical protein